MKDLYRGSGQAFDANWRGRAEAQYNHWIKGNPQNQIQLAFRNHWSLFKELLPENTTKCIEVGCGRGSMSSYFADNGIHTTLVDLSPAIIETAEKIFETNGHAGMAEFVVGDALALDMPDNSYDVAVSIGLLEHFENVGDVIKEQVRVLKPGGRFLGYVVPERPDNVQKNWNWLNKILAFFAKMALGKNNKHLIEKEDIFRSDFGSEHYKRASEGLPIEQWEAFGMYPMPMISHSPEFPFSLLPKPLEKVLTSCFRLTLALRRKIYGRHPWKCDESLGQAFLITFVKSKSEANVNG